MCSWGNIGRLGRGDNKKEEKKDPGRSRGRIVNRVAIGSYFNRIIFLTCAWASACTR